MTLLLLCVPSWEQGTAAMAVLEADDREYSVFSSDPYRNHGRVPAATLRLALSAVTRQAEDGRLSQFVGDGNDGSALDGASNGVVVLLGELSSGFWVCACGELRPTLLFWRLGMYAQPSRRDYWREAADRQLGYVSSTNLIAIPSTLI